MNKIEYLLQCLQEECGEVTQEASKCNRFGKDDKGAGQENNNLEKLEIEFNDVLAVLELLAKEGLVIEIRPELIEQKRARLEYWMDYSRRKGTLIENSIIN